MKDTKKEWLLKQIESEKMQKERVNWFNVRLELIADKESNELKIRHVKIEKPKYARQVFKFVIIIGILISFHSMVFHIISNVLLSLIIFTVFTVITYSILEFHRYFNLEYEQVIVHEEIKK